jgi:uncharacterized protein YdeI (YjbR/CyaY-like superfamily)
VANEVPTDLVKALEGEGMDRDFERLRPDVRDNFTIWLHRADSAEMRKRRIARIIAAIKAIRKETGT